MDFSPGPNSNFNPGQCNENGCLRSPWAHQRVCGTLVKKEQCKSQEPEELKKPSLCPSIECALLTGRGWVLGTELGKEELTSH